jgi:hypothetical protein
VPSVTDTADRAGTKLRQPREMICPPLWECWWRGLIGTLCSGRGGLQRIKFSEGWLLVAMGLCGNEILILGRGMLKLAPIIVSHDEFLSPPEVANWRSVSSGRQHTLTIVNRLKENGDEFSFSPLGQSLDFKMMIVMRILSSTQGERIMHGIQFLLNPFCRNFPTWQV